MRVAVGGLAVLVLAALLVLGQRTGRLTLASSRTAFGTLVLLGPLGVAALAGRRVVHWVEFHQGLAVAGGLALVVAAVVLPALVIRPAVTPGVAPGS